LEDKGKKSGGSEEERKEDEEEEDWQEKNRGKGRLISSL